MNKVKNNGTRLIMFLLVEYWIVRDRFPAVGSSHDHFVTLSKGSHQNPVCENITG